MMSHCLNPFYGSPLLSDNFKPFGMADMVLQDLSPLHSLYMPQLSWGAWDPTNTPCLLMSSRLCTRCPLCLESHAYFICRFNFYMSLGPKSGIISCQHSLTRLNDPPHLGSSQGWHICSVITVCSPSVFATNLWAHGGQEPCLIHFTPSTWQGAWHKADIQTFVEFIHSLIR